MAGSFSIRIKGGPEIAAALAKIDAKTSGGLARGAVGEGANTIRDQARQIATKNGLAQTGTVTTERGNTITLRGQIPGSIFAAVDKKVGNKQLAKVSIDTGKSESGRPKSKNRTPHWVMVEFGSLHNAARPFLRPGLIQGAPAAVDAMIDVLSRGMKRYNVPGG